MGKTVGEPINVGSMAGEVTPGKSGVSVDKMAIQITY
jgi:hypothetical protein